MENDKNSSIEKTDEAPAKKTVMSRISAWFDSHMPFPGATENTVFRIKAFTLSLVGVGTALFLVAQLGFLYSMGSKYGIIPSFSQDSYSLEVAVVDIQEIITQELAERFIEKMEMLREDEAVESVLLIISSGGGSPSASDEIANYLIDFQKDKKVHMYIQGMAASGAYYIASSVKPIFSNPNAIVGSIGVMLPHYFVGDLADKLGVEEDHLTAGKFKIPMTMFKKLGDGDKEYLNSNLLDPTYKTFVGFVAEQRGLEYTKMEQYAEGKIFVASMEEVRGVLVDKLTNETSLKREIKENILLHNQDLTKKQVGFVQVDISAKRSGGLFGVNVNVNGADLMKSAIPQSFSLQ